MPRQEVDGAPRRGAAELERQALAAERPLPLETEVDLKFSLPYSTREIQAAGRVVRYTDPDAEGLVGLAVHFDTISEEDREAIAAFIADRTAAKAAEA